MKISIITVVKNDKKNLLISLRSILSQRLKNFEYIICDGMSQDGTKFIIKNFLYKKIKYIRRYDKNYYEGLNYAIKIAKGDYIGILNAGDKYFNSKILENINKKIFHTKCDLLFGNLMFINKKKKISRVWKFPVNKLNTLTALKIASPTIFIRRNIALHQPYNTRYNISSDTDFNIKISKNKIKFIYLNNFLILMKMGGLSTNYKFFFKKMGQDILILIEHFKFLFLLVYIYKVFIKLKTIKIN